MLHHNTLLLVQASIALLTTALIVVAALGAGRRAELLWWAAGNVVATIGLLVSAQGHWPAALHAVLSYGLMALGLALVWRGLRIFCGSELSNAAIAAVVAVALGLAAFLTFVVPSLEARLIVSSLGIGGLNLVCAATLVRGVRDASRPVMWVCAGGFAALGLALIGRAAILAGTAGNEEVRQLLVSASVWATALAQVTIAFGLILMLARQYAEELRQASITDRLTGALNRAGLEQQAARMLRRAQRAGQGLVVIMLDVDHFKQVNDRHGHPAGDLVLRALVQRLREELRPGDVVARYGGEEFLLVLDALDLAAGVVVAERVRRAIADTPVPVPGAHIHLTASFGVASVTQTGYDADGLVQQADAAVYRAKAEGRNRVVVAEPAAGEVTVARLAGAAAA